MVEPRVGSNDLDIVSVPKRGVAFVFMIDEQGLDQSGVRMENTVGSAR